MRSEIGINPGKEVRGIFATDNAIYRSILVANRQDIEFLARLSHLDIQSVPDAPTVRATAVTPDGVDVFLDLEGVIDVPAERSRLEKEIQKTLAELDRVKTKISNPEFIQKAPESVVEKNKLQERELQEKLVKLQEAHQLLLQT